MELNVLHGSTCLGTGILQHLDPPMGVAFGPFAPSDRDDRAQHANVIDGDYAGDPRQAFSVCSGRHGCLNLAAVSIEDWTDALGERRLTVWFQDGGKFASLFSEYDDCKAYYR